MNWLIAEDEADIRNLVATMCQIWGHNPMPFENGQKAWEFLDQIEAGTNTQPLPEFALMDIRMPGYRGDQIAKRIRETEKIKNIAVVLMTAFVLSDEEMTTMKRDTGVDHIINKPLPDFMALKAMLESIIEQKKEVVAKQATQADSSKPQAEPEKQQSVNDKSSKETNLSKTSDKSAKDNNQSVSATSDKKN